MFTLRRRLSGRLSSRTLRGGGSSGGQGTVQSSGTVYSKLESMVLSVARIGPSIFQLVRMRACGWRRLGGHSTPRGCPCTFRSKLPHDPLPHRFQNFPNCKHPDHSRVLVYDFLLKLVRQCSSTLGPLRSRQNLRTMVNRQSRRPKGLRIS
jgi:hypothetical protein